MQNLMLVPVNHASGSQNVMSSPQHTPPQQQFAGRHNGDASAQLTQQQLQQLQANTNDQAVMIGNQASKNPKPGPKSAKAPSILVGGPTPLLFGSNSSKV